jgi:hypothetical protein
MLAPLLAALVLAQAPPETTIVSGPPAVSSAAIATFTFTASEPAATFQCSLDDSVLSACTSPFTTPALTDGSHTFSVRSVDAAGVADPTPATADFTVELPVAALLHGSFTHAARTTGVKTLTISGVPRGGTVTATCRGHGCPFHGPKAFKAKARVAKLTDGFKKAKLRTRAVVEITVAAPGATTKVFRLTFHKPPANPRVAILCIPPGTTQAQDCGAD